MLADNDMLEEEPLLLPSLVCAAPLPLLPLPLPLPMSLLAAAAVAAASARAVSCRVDSSRTEVGQPQPTPGVTWRILLKKANSYYINDILCDYYDNIIMIS